jgi:SOS-response transcriptional repressor LexA
MLGNSGINIMHELTAEYANKVHQLVERLETNEAERRYRQRKRATEEKSDDAMEEEGDDSAEWQMQRRRGRAPASSATREPGAPGGPARASGTPATPSAEGRGSLTEGVAAGLHAASLAAAAGQAQQSTSGGDGQFT